MTTPKKQLQGVVPAIPLPSADLIIYRFDQTDKKFEEISLKLDGLTNNFVTKEEAALMKEERDAKFLDIDKKFESYRWYFRALVTATLLCLATVVGSLLTRHGQ